MSCDYTAEWWAPCKILLHERTFIDTVLVNEWALKLYKKNLKPLKLLVPSITFQPMVHNLMSRKHNINISDLWLNSGKKKKKKRLICNVISRMLVLFSLLPSEIQLLSLMVPLLVYVSILRENLVNIFSKFLFNFSDKVVFRWLTSGLWVCAAGVLEEATDRIPEPTYLWDIQTIWMTSRVENTLFAVNQNDEFLTYLLMKGTYLAVMKSFPSLLIIVCYVNSSSVLVFYRTGPIYLCLMILTETATSEWWNKIYSKYTNSSNYS